MNADVKTTGDPAGCLHVRWRLAPGALRSDPGRRPRTTLLAVLAVTAALCLAGPGWAQAKDGSAADAEAHAAAEAAKLDKQRAEEADLAKKRAAMAAEEAARANARAAEARANAEQEARRIAAPAPGGIFVPPPRGGETLDDAGPAPAGAAGGADTVHTALGDRLIGSVLRIEPGGRLFMTAPAFEGPLSVSTAALRDINFQAKPLAAGPHVVLLTNGDRIRGQLVAIDEQAVSLRTEMAGDLRIARKFVRSLNLSGAPGATVESDFSTGGLEPWKVLQGAWQVKDGQLFSGTRGGLEAVFAEVEQTQALTMQAQVEALPGLSLRCDLSIFADDMRPPYGGESITASFHSGQCFLYYTSRNSGTTSLAVRPLNASVRGGVMGVSYDPQAGKARMWLDSQDFGEFAVPAGLLKGRYVLFSTRYPCKVASLRVVPGVVGPAAGAKAPRGGQKDLIECGPNDRVSVDSLSLADGTVGGLSAAGEFRCPLEKVQTIVLRSGDQEEPRKRKGDAHVRAGAGRLTVELLSLDEQFLHARCEALGTLRLARPAIQGIRFDIYK